MDARLTDRIETTVERTASAIFAGAVGYAAYASLTLLDVRPQPIVYAAAVGAVAYWLCLRTLKVAAQRRSAFVLSLFNVRDIDPFAPDELLLTEADRLEDRRIDDELVLTEADRLVPAVGGAEPLLLDDILEELGPDSRVVRLFDRKAMPTPGQLKLQIDDHLEKGSAPLQSDAAHALSDALAELRRSLR